MKERAGTQFFFVGSELHSLSLECGRAFKVKQEMFLELLWIFNDLGIDASGVMDILNVFVILQSMEKKCDFNAAWFMISKIMRGIGKEITRE